MSGGAESSILPSLNSDVSALSAPKSRDVARNGGENASFASVLDSQSPPKSPPSDPAASSNAQTNDSRSGKVLPPKAENTAASDPASHTTTDDSKRLVAELVAELADFQANASGTSFGSLVSGQAVDSQNGNAQPLGAIQAVNLSGDLSLAANAPFTVSELLNRADLGGSLATPAVGSSDAVPGLSTASTTGLTTASTTGLTTGDVSSASRAADLVLGREAAIANSSGQADALLNARTAVAQPELDISQVSANILGTSQVSKYSQTKAGELLSQDGVLAKQTALGTDDVSFDAMLLKQGRAITPSETIDRMLALHARQEGQPAISSASATGAAPLAVGHTGAPSLTGHQVAGTGALADQFALYHSPAEPEFAEEFTARVQMMAKDGLREARLQLHPAELGRLQVSVTTEGDQARVTFLAETSAARDLIEQNLPRLREMLEEQGLQLAQSDVGQSDGEALADEGARGASNAVNDLQQDSEVDAELAPAMLAYASTTSRIDIHV